MSPEPDSAPRDDPNDIADSVNRHVNSHAENQQEMVSQDQVTQAANNNSRQANGKAVDSPESDQGCPVGAQDNHPKKKKKKSSGRNRKGKKRGTGFEEYYCDSPITLDEYEEERRIYDPANSFDSRIEECIQRYRARRRLDNAQDNLFSKYLILGGVDSTVRQFQSTRNINDETLEEATKSELRTITADDVIQRGKSDPRFYNPNDSEHWTVDFAGVVSGFISVRLLYLVGADEGMIEKGIKVVLNFLKYVELHEVCPEYMDDVKRAQSICNSATEEMPLVFRLSESLPGDFNRAARTLFCPIDGGDDTAFLFDNERNYHTMSWQQAKAVFFGAMVAWTTPKFCEELVSNDVRVDSTFEQVFEVLPFEEPWLPGTTIIKQYKRIRNEDGKPGCIQPTGSLFLKPSAVKDGWDVGDETGEDNCNVLLPEKTQFFLEHELIVQIKPGMKLRLVVCKMNIDLFFIKEVKQVYPTFYTFLPQELMIAYKEPVPNDRPAPSLLTKICRKTSSSCATCQT